MDSLNFKSIINHYIGTMKTVFIKDGVIHFGNQGNIWYYQIIKFLVDRRIYVLILK